LAWFDGREAGCDARRDDDHRRATDQVSLPGLPAKLHEVGRTDPTGN
jgi:hypothetical protein